MQKQFFFSPRVWLDQKSKNFHEKESVKNRKTKAVSRANIKPESKEIKTLKYSRR